MGGDLVLADQMHQIACSTVRLEVFYKEKENKIFLPRQENMMHLILTRILDANASET